MKVFIEKREIVDHCAENNKGEFNFEKMIEELAEFQEVTAKIRTKHPNNPDRPKRDEIVKEFGDLIYRGIIYIKCQFPDITLPELMDKIEARIHKKLTNLEEYKNLGRYNAGL